MNSEQIGGIVRLLIASGVTYMSKAGWIPGIDPTALTSDLTCFAALLIVSLWHYVRHDVVSIPIIAAFLFLASNTNSNATDLAAQNTRANGTPCDVASCNGGYAFVGVGGQGTNLDILGSGLSGSVFADGAEFTLGGGYELWNGKYFVAVEAGGGYSVPASGQAIAPSDRLDGYATIKAGIGISNLFGAVTSPTTFDALAANVISPYAIIGPRFKAGMTGVSTGAGLQYSLGNHWAVSVEAIHTNYNSTQGAIVTNTDNLIQLRFERHNLF